MWIEDADIIDNNINFNAYPEEIICRQVFQRWEKLEQLEEKCYIIISQG
jgi:hypothetical protein